MKNFYFLLVFYIPLALTFECGVKKITQPGALIHGGQVSFKGQWPWLASLHKMTNGKQKSEYFCGSTIISEKTLITGCGRNTFKKLLLHNIISSYSRSLH
jgi:hypothetical protein